MCFLKSTSPTILDTQFQPVIELLLKEFSLQHHPYPFPSCFCTCHCWLHLTTLQIYYMPMTMSLLYYMPMTMSLLNLSQMLHAPNTLPYYWNCSSLPNAILTSNNKNFTFTKRTTQYVHLRIRSCLVFILAAFHSRTASLLWHYQHKQDDMHATTGDSCDVHIECYPKWNCT